MVELVDTTDLKSVDLTVVRVQVPLRVPSGRLQRCGLPFLVLSIRIEHLIIPSVPIIRTCAMR